jgi:SHS2 domain-containing protein
VGYEERTHTADWALRVWADDLPGLFGEAARGMNALSGAQLGDGPPIRRSLTLQAPDPESLLVAFLSELVYYAEQENLGFDRFEIHIQGAGLQAKLEGAALRSLSKAVKAVTYNDLHIRQAGGRFETEIVFDV